MFFLCSCYLSDDGRKTSHLACVSLSYITTDQPPSFRRADCDETLRVAFEIRGDGIMFRAGGTSDVMHCEHGKRLIHQAWLSAANSSISCFFGDGCSGGRGTRREGERGRSLQTLLMNLAVRGLCPAALLSSPPPPITLDPGEEVENVKGY